ncbi:MAG: tail fiber domain-containing protein [Patescibacteria group bacterium]|nr:tail fiber domain-containing protein [Patescibacteria group bacterium]
MKKLIKNPLFYLSFILVLVLAFQIVSFVRAAFQEPSSGFPDGSAPAPLDTGSSEQTKFGKLNIDIGVAEALEILGGGTLCLPDGAGNRVCKGAWNQIGQWSRSGSDIYYDAGNVAVGTADPLGYKFYVNGEAFAVTGWSSSDIQLKENIVQLTGVLERLQNIRGVKFDWRTTEFPDRGLPEGREIGFIAQEVEKVFPELVSTDNDGYKALSYGHLTAILLEAIKEQQVQINELTSRLQKLEGLSN